MFLARKYTEKGPEHRQEPVFRILGESSGTGACFPIISSNSGMRLTSSWPFGPTASRSASRRRATSASLRLRISRIRV